MPPASRSISFDAATIISPEVRAMPSKPSFAELSDTMVDLVVTDYDMPELDPEFAERLRQQPRAD